MFLLLALNIFLLTGYNVTIPCYQSLTSFIKRQTSNTSSDKEWQRVVQRLTVSGKTSDNEWQQVIISANFLFSFFFWISDEPTTMHPKENLFNLKEGLEQDLLRVDLTKKSPLEWILTVRIVTFEIHTILKSYKDSVTLT